MKSIPLFLMALLVTVPTASPAGATSPGATSPGMIVDGIEEVNALRESLAAGLKEIPREKITFDTFKATCAPVGARLKEWSDKHAVKASQQTKRFRNLKNELRPELRNLYSKFESDSQLVSIRTNSGVYARAIRVEEGCLKCHGDAKSLPDFIREKYPNDRAANFKVGDLRGIYVVE